VPERDLERSEHGPALRRERIASHKAYGAASVLEIFGDRLKQAGPVAAKHPGFDVVPQSPELFRSGAAAAGGPVRAGFCRRVADFDGDGNEDVFLSQNFFATQPDTSRSDAGRGLWLRGDGEGGWRPCRRQESGIRVYGEQRGAAGCDFDGDGRVDLVVAQNGARTILYRNARGHPGLRVRLQDHLAIPPASGPRCGS